jgi:hypothetical protein
VPVERGERLAQRKEVAMDVGDQADAHAGSLPINRGS